MAADNKEAAPNEKASADAVALTSAPLLVSEIKDEEGAAPKENPFADMAAPSKAITAGVVAADVPKEKSVSVADEVSYFFSSTPLSLETETEPVPPLMMEKEDEPKENIPPPPDLGDANNAAPKEKLLSYFFLHWSLREHARPAVGCQTRTLSCFYLFPCECFFLLP